MKTSYVLSATGTLGDKLYYGSLCQYMSKHLIVVFFFSHRYNTVPHLLHVSQESLGLDKQNSNNTASHLSFSNHMLAFHGYWHRVTSKERKIDLYFFFLIKNKIQYSLCQDN